MSEELVKGHLCRGLRKRVVKPRQKKVSTRQRNPMEQFFDFFHRTMLERVPEFLETHRVYNNVEPDPVRDRAMEVAAVRALNHTAAAIRRKRARGGRSQPEIRHYVLDCLRLMAPVFGRYMRLENFAESLAEASRANDLDYVRELVRWHDEAKAVSPDPLDVKLMHLWMEDPKLTDKELASRIGKINATEVRDRRLRLGLKKRGR
jgi:hypothetical protein